MKTLTIAVTCLGLGAGISHAKDIAAILGGIGKEPSKEETWAELQPVMDKMDVDDLQTTLVDYAHRAKVLQIQVEKEKKAQDEFLDMISSLRAEIKALKAN